MGLRAMLTTLVLVVGLAVPADAAVPNRYTWPTGVSANGRYLVDQHGKPYLIAGDSPQGLFVTMSEPQAWRFFVNRRIAGFNALWINSLVTVDQGGRPDDSTFDGIVPFTTPGDLSTPNEQYFGRIERMVAMAQGQGLTIWLNPVETCGHLPLLRANGVDKARAFGAYLGKRLRSYPNIVWFNGCDLQTWRDPADTALVQAVARGIKDVDPGHLQTVELNYLSSGSLDDPTWAEYIKLDAAYTYYPTYAQVLKEYNRPQHMPVYLTEANYESEHDYTGPKTLRRQEYWTTLSGATGQFYGSGYTWQFKPGWQDHVDTPGTEQFEYVTDILRENRWYDLVPDQQHTLVTAGYGTFNPYGNVNDNDYATAARTEDGSTALVYVPTARTVTVDLGRMRGEVTAVWYDPTNGEYRDTAADGSGRFTTPGRNAEGEDDWVLLLQAG
ncbi:DUF4038 domain-containing protein [Kutzneria viridogrisea]|uniref:Collagen-binding domain of a collagenase n=1 Tax=Kutzneria viridogrisea TaxID=47990 RepID=A0ABR6B8D9_9PSEU|nr:hypothetical protein [Kutzneria viridogrisea]